MENQRESCDECDDCVANRFETDRQPAVCSSQRKTNLRVKRGCGDVGLRVNPWKVVVVGGGVDPAGNVIMHTSIVLYTVIGLTRRSTANGLRLGLTLTLTLTFLYQFPVRVCSCPFCIIDRLCRYLQILIEPCLCIAAKTLRVDPPFARVNPLLSVHHSLSGMCCLWLRTTCRHILY